MKKLNKLVGTQGETLAVKYLSGKGYEIIKRNYKNEYGEIDIIAAHEGYLVFVEVKTRSTLMYGMPSEAVDAHKKRKISQVASQYIRFNKLYDYPVRFDVIEVCGEELDHIEDAFDSYLKY